MLIWELDKWFFMVVFMSTFSGWWMDFPKYFFFTRSALINCFVFQKKIEKSEEMKFPGSITIIVGRLSISTRRNTTTSDGSSAPETSYTQRPWRKPSVTIDVEIEIPFFSLHSSLPSHMYLLGNYLIPQYPRGFIKSKKKRLIVYLHTSLEAELR